MAEELAYYYKNTEKIEEKIENAYHFAKQQTWKNVANTYLKLWSMEK